MTTNATTHDICVMGWNLPATRAIIKTVWLPLLLAFFRLLSSMQYFVMPMAPGERILPPESEPFSIAASSPFSSLQDRVPVALIFSRWRSLSPEV